MVMWVGAFAFLWPAMTLPMRALSMVIQAAAPAPCEEDPVYESAFQRVLDSHCGVQPAPRYGSWVGEIGGSETGQDECKDRFCEIAELTCSGHKLFWASLLQKL